MEQKLEIDSATNLSTGERIARDRERRPFHATLRAVQLTDIGRISGPGVAVVKLAGEEHSLEQGLVFNPKIMGNLARESLETSNLATLGTVLWMGSGKTGVNGEPAARLVAEEQKLEVESAPNLCTGGRSVLDRTSTGSCVTLV